MPVSGYVAGYVSDYVPEQSVSLYVPLGGKTESSTPYEPPTETRRLVVTWTGARVTTESGALVTWGE